MNTRLITMRSQPNCFKLFCFVVVALVVLVLVVVVIGVWCGSVQKLCWVVVSFVR